MESQWGLIVEVDRNRMDFDRNLDGISMEFGVEFCWKFVGIRLTLAEIRLEFDCMKRGFSLAGTCLNLLVIWAERGWNLSGGWVEIGWNLINMFFWNVVGFWL